MTAGVTLIVRRTIRASPERLFDAWTQPALLRQWWGPESVICSDAQVDLEVGGRYRIANRFPDGSTVWISGEFEAIERPNRLVYTWRVGSAAAAAERVTVSFEARGTSTDVVVTHERIPDPATRDQHEHGWRGCLDGLERWIASPA
jgi:uncharacterized protein YndB with AHSA1/START domain